MKKVLNALKKYLKIFIGLKILRIAIYIGLIIWASTWIARSPYFSFTSILSEEFIISFFGVMLGFALTIHTYIISITERIITHKHDDVIKRTKKINSEVSQDIYMVLICFLLTGIAAFIDRAALDDILYLDIEYVHKCFIVSTLLLSSLALIDLTITSINLSHAINSIEHSKSKETV